MYSPRFDATAAPPMPKCPDYRITELGAPEVAVIGACALGCEPPAGKKGERGKGGGGGSGVGGGGSQGSGVKS